MEQIETPVIFFYILMLSVGCIIVLCYFGLQIKRNVDILDDIREDIYNAKANLSTLEDMIISKKEELERTKVEIELSNAVISEAKEKAEYFRSCLESVNDDLGELKESIQGYGVYINAAIAMLQGQTFEADGEYVYEIPFLGEWITALRLRTNIFEALMASKIYSVWELVLKSKDELLALNGIGRASVEEISRELDANGCYLGMCFVNFNGKYFTSTKYLTSNE